MRKCSRFFTVILSLASVSIFLSSCKDDEPTPPSEIAFAESEITVNEADGIIEIEIVLDKPAQEDLIIEYSLGGTAIDVVSAGTQYAPDYEILSDYLELNIDKGETSGVIEIELISDYYLESLTNPETIEIEIESVNSEKAKITNDDDITILVEQEDGMAILLEWPEPGPNGQADMDLILRKGSTIVAGSLLETYASGELVFVPLSTSAGTFGVSYTYYAGTLNPLNFEVTYVDVAGGVIEAESQTVTFQATYTLSNINAWTNLNSTLVVQTFQKSGSAFTSFSAITPSPTGSRMNLGEELPTILKKGGQPNFLLPLGKARLK
jgi:hypothetical protein